MRFLFQVLFIQGFYTDSMAAHVAFNQMWLSRYPLSKHTFLKHDILCDSTFYVATSPEDFFKFSPVFISLYKVFMYVYIDGSRAVGRVGLS